MGRLALLSTIYTAARSGETRHAVWSDMTMAKVHKLAAPGTVPHCWRSTFRD
jgi:hypothetical protein